jgi:hypothetical protein
MKSPTKIEFMIQLWRIVLSVAVAQIVSFTLGSTLKISHDPFMNSWIAGATVTPIAFVIGLLWHISDKKRRTTTPWLSVGFIGLLSLFVGVMSIFVKSMEIQQAGNIELLKHLSEDDIKQIHVYDRYGGTHLTTITNKATIAEFRSYSADISGFSFNHDTSTFRCCLILEGSQNQEISFRFIERRPHSAIGSLTKREGNVSKNLGVFESQKLRGWIEKHIIQNES